jgi:hypothetical protein
VKGYSLLKKTSEGTIKTEPENRADKLVDTLLTEPKKGLPKKDRISDFYSAIKGGSKGIFRNAHTKRISDLASPSSQKTNLAINKNTADRHGRT